MTTVAPSEDRASTLPSVEIIEPEHRKHARLPSDLLRMLLALAAAGLVALYVTLVATPHPLGLHGGGWGLLVNFAVTIVVSRVTAPPSDETAERIHGAVERFVYEGDPA